MHRTRECNLRNNWKSITITNLNLNNRYLHNYCTKTKQGLKKRKGENNNRMIVKLSWWNLKQSSPKRVQPRGRYDFVSHLGSRATRIFYSTSVLYCKIQPTRKQTETNRALVHAHVRAFHQAAITRQIVQSFPIFFSLSPSLRSLRRLFVLFDTRCQRPNDDRLENVNLLVCRLK